MTSTLNAYDNASNQLAKGKREKKLIYKITVLFVTAYTVQPITQNTLYSEVNKRIVTWGNVRSKSVVL